MIYAKYTIVLKTLLDDPQSKAMIDRAMSTYPLYLPKNPENFTIVPTREEINKKILDHFKYREIGFETFGRFLDELEIALNEIMPYYNQLFNSEDIINGLEDIFGNLDVTDTYERETSGTTSNTSERSETDTIEGSESSTGKETSDSSATNQNSTTDSSTTSNTMNNTSKDVESQTPQDSLEITAKNIDSVTYADKVNWNKSDSSSSGTSSGTATSNGTTTGSNEIDRSNEIEKSETATKTGNVSDTGSSSGTENYTLHRKGNQGVNTYAHDMLEFRQLFMNIVVKIINDKRIQDLFMQVY